jgi:poly-gamma-glutamate capsule biosynthesis protein CapA/YwtB (metallophosphatase superfamily)
MMNLLKNNIRLTKWMAGCLFTAVLIVLPFAIFFSGSKGNAKTSTDNASCEDFDSFRAEKENLPVRGETVTLIAVGDVMLSRNVASKMSEKGMDYPFLKTRDYLRSGDIVFGNLETPIFPGRKISRSEMIFRSDPGSEKTLVDSGFDILSLANNHTPNFGKKSLKDTFKYLDQAGLIYAGAGENESDAHAPAIIETKGFRFAFLAYNDTDVVPDNWEAISNSPGTAFMDKKKMQRDVKAAKANADFVIVSMHSGYEYKPKPNNHQIDFSHSAIDAGADLVIGHHPHVVQTIEKYKDKFIFYSLGNFVFDQMWSQETREGLVAKFIFSADGIEKIDLLPVLIEDYSQPSFTESKTVSRVLDRLDYPLDNRMVVVWDEKQKTYTTKIGYTISAKQQPSQSKMERMEFVDFDSEISDERIFLENGRVRLEQDYSVVWQSSDDWWIDDFRVDDSTGDGELKLNMSAWRAGNFGRSKPFWIEKNDMSIKNHLFVMRYSQGDFKSVWMSSNLSKPNREFVFADFDCDSHSELAVIESEYGRESSGFGEYVAIWKWNEWGFFNEWRSKKGQYKNLSVEKIDNQIRVAADCVSVDDN